MQIKYICSAFVVTFLAVGAASQPSNPKEACLAANKAALEKNRAAVKAASDAKQFSPEAAAKFKASQENIAVLSRGSKFSPSCFEVTKVIAAETKNVAEWIKASATAAPKRAGPN